MRKNFLASNGTKIDFVLFGVASNKVPSIVLPITDDGNVVAVVQYRYGAEEFILELPGGNPKETESPEEVARMELVEETGYSCERMKPLAGKSIFFDPASSQNSFWPFLAEGCRPDTDQSLDLEEVVRVVEIPLDEWTSLVLRGEVVDAKSVTTTFFAVQYLISTWGPKLNKRS